MILSSIVALIVFVAVCFLAAATGIMFKPGQWYEDLRKPSWQPPKWVFAPVWTLLYCMIAVSGWLVWRVADQLALAIPMGLYCLQLLLNAFWTPVFFGMHRLGLGLAVIIALWLAIAATIAAFATVSFTAALLMVPYLLWVTFAVSLSYAIWRRNRP